MNKRTGKAPSIKGRRGFLGAAAAASLMAGAAQAGSPIQNPPPKKQREKIKVGQIGVGHAHASKLSVYRKSEDYEVVGICEPNPKLRQRAEKQSTYKDLPWLTKEQLLNGKDLDVVLVETEVRDLLDNAELCVAAGKHVHLDKPAGSSFVQYQRLLEDAKRKDLMVQMGYMYRYNPAILLLRDLLSKGWLGEVFEVHTVMSKVVSSSARKQLAEYPGGMMFELGCHILDLVIGVLGRPTKVSSVHRHSSELDDQLVDNMLAILEYENAMATIKSSALEVEGFARRHFVVCGTHGTLHIQPLDNPTVKLALDRKREKFKAGYQTVEFPRYSRYVGDAADMAKIIRGEKEADYSYEHDRIVQETLLQACRLPLDK